MSGLDVLVVGGGIAGSMVSYYLSSAGFSVALADADMEAGVSTSIYNAGSLDERPSFTGVRPVAAAAASFLGRYSPVGATVGSLLRNAGWVLRALKVDRRTRDPIEERLLNLSLALWDDLAKGDPGLDYYSRRGLRLYMDFARAEEESRRTGGRLLDERDLEDIGFTGFQGGVELESRWVNPHAVMRRMKEKLVEAGVEVRREEVHLKAESSGLVRAVNPELRADAYVVAAGAWTDALCRPLGCRLGVLPARGVAVIAGYDEGAVGLPALLEDLGAVVALHGRSTLRLTGYFELAGYSTRGAAQRAERLLARIGGHLRVRGLRAVEVGVGMRPCTHDQLPVVGAVPGYRNLYVATGGCRRGVTMAPLMGRIIVDVMSGRGLEGDMRALDPSRIVGPGG